MGLAHVACILVVIAFSIINVSHYVIRFTVLMGYAQGIVSMIVYYFIVVQTLVCFARVCGTSPGRPKELLERGVPSMQNGTTRSGKQLRTCNKCQCYKPDRCHHCSDCQACTLKMDHHCPWVNNCVGFQNYKYFVLFLINSALACAYTIGLLIYVISQRSDQLEAWEISSIVNVVVVGIFGIGVFGLMGYHINLMSSNQTTIEQLKCGNPEEFSLGVVENVRQVLGANALVWCVPCVWGVSPSYDGVEWGQPEEDTDMTSVVTTVTASGTGVDHGAARSNVDMVCQVVQPSQLGSGNGSGGGTRPGSNGISLLNGGETWTAGSAPLPLASPASLANGRAVDFNGSSLGQRSSTPVVAAAAIGDITLVVEGASNGHQHSQLSGNGLMGRATEVGSLGGGEVGGGPMARLSRSML